MKVSTTIFAIEFYKLFVTNKVAILLIIFIAFQIYNFTNTNKSTSYTENIYKSYMEVLSGKLTKEKEEFINNGVNSKEFVYVYLILADVDIKDITLQKKEVSEAKWFKKQEFLELMGKEQIIIEMLKDIFV